MNRMTRDAAKSLVFFCLFQPGIRADEPAIKPDDPASEVHPRRFGLPGGIGKTRGWYIWYGWNPKSWMAEVAHEGTGQKFTVRVLPWVTTYRHLGYGARPDDLLPGERVNMFFNPEGKVSRAYLVHFQDEMCQMKGHNHAWQVESVTADGFSARVMAGDKPLDKDSATFVFDKKCQFWQGGKIVESVKLAVGERLLLTFVYEDKRRVVKLLSDASSAKVIEAETRERLRQRVRREGMTGYVEEAEGGKAKVLIFSNWWYQANELKPGANLKLQTTNASYEPLGTAMNVKLVSRKNLGTYGSGCSELWVDGLEKEQVELLRKWGPTQVVRIFGP